MSVYVLENINEVIDETSAAVNWDLTRFIIFSKYQ